MTVMNRARGTRWFAGSAGALLLLFGLLCLNYTQMGNFERHSRFAQQHGLPEPSRRIAFLGMLLAPFGGGLIGFAVGCRRRESAGASGV
jgi:hypothetical protein